MEGFNDSCFKYKEYSFLVTGGAGFIGSNLVEYLLKKKAKKVRVIDNLSNGYLQNIERFIGLDNFDFIKGDITDYNICIKAMSGIDYVSHQAALGSVPRSILDPISSNDANISGFLNILWAAKETESVKGFVYAASSSTYGDSEKLPKKEGEEGQPLSPYAITKLVNELYANVFSKVYGFNSIGLRYFNVFGPNQNPNNPYAAVIPIFTKKVLKNEEVIIFGDGETSRDFTYVDNAVQANILGFIYSKEIRESRVYNVACGERYTLNQVVALLQKHIGNKGIDVKYESEREGDIKHSRADINKISKELNYSPIVRFEKGLLKYIQWLKRSNP